MMPNRNGVVVILCGLPSSGKSVFAKHLGDNLSSILPTMKIQILDIDQVRIALFEGVFEPENEQFVRETALMQTRDYLKKNVIVIIDDINYYNSMRHEFKQIADELSKPNLILHISTPLEICLKWNAKRKNSLDSQIITKIAENFDLPGQKYMWDTPFDTINMTENNIKLKITRISEKIHSLVIENPIDIERKGNTNHSITHTIDTLTRIFVNFYAKTVLHSNSNRNKEESSVELLDFNIKIIHQVSKLPQFQQIQSKFSSKINMVFIGRRVNP